MKNRLAQRDAVRIFYVQKQHIVIISGRKPANAFVRVVEVPGNPKTPLIRLELCGGESSAYPSASSSAPIGGNESYYVVKPVLGPILRPKVCPQHAFGEDFINTEQIHAGFAPTVAANSFTGISQNFNFDEAFRDALRTLPNLASGNDSLIQVVSMGAIYGGFHGFSRMFVRLEHTQLTAPEAARLGDSLQSEQSPVLLPAAQTRYSKRNF